MLKSSDPSPVPAAVFVSDVQIILRGSEGETVQILFPMFTVRFFFYSNFVNIFVLISTKSNFILLRFYGEKVLYK